MRVVSALALAGLILLGATDRSSARVQAQMYCWELDSEFPVPCEQEDEEDEGFRGRFQVRDTGIAGLRPET
jgi:hypothetical protein